MENVTAAVLGGLLPTLLVVTLMIVAGLVGIEDPMDGLRRRWPLVAATLIGALAIWIGLEIAIFRLTTPDIDRLEILLASWLEGLIPVVVIVASLIIAGQIGRGKAIAGLRRRWPLITAVLIGTLIIAIGLRIVIAELNS